MPKITPKKNQFDIDSIFDEAVQEVRKKEIQELSKTPLDIISYCELLKENLFPSQNLILKMFYAGTRFNENLRVLPEDIEIVRDWEIEQAWLTQGEKGKVSLLKKIKEQSNNQIFGYNTHPFFFREMILVIGRRGCKSYLSALIASYEAYKLIMLKDPQKFYGINSDIYILNAAVSADQAEQQIFNEIRKFIMKCPVFEGRVSPRHSTKMMRLYTDPDLEQMKRSKEEFGRALDGSIVLLSGSSNSPALRGKAAICIIYDEFAHFVDTATGKSSAKEVYNALSRSTSTFWEKGDGRNIVISSPKEPYSPFYDLYQSSKRIDTMLMFQASTWDINPNITKESLAPEFEKDPDLAEVEYGAKFSHKITSRFFPPEKIDEATTIFENWYMQERGQPGRIYYLHIDAADSSDRYAYLLAHPEYIYDKELGENIMYIVEDYSAFVVPPVNGYIDPDEIVDKNILPLFDKFNINAVSYDGVFTIEQIKKIRRKGVGTRLISFAGKQKNVLYDGARNLLMRNRIIICADDFQLINEMKHIVADYHKSPPKITKDVNGECPYDDVCDCLCGVISSMMLGSEGITRLPRMMIAHTPSIR